MGMCAYGVLLGCSASGTSDGARPRSTATPPAGSRHAHERQPDRGRGRWRGPGRPWRGQSPQERRGPGAGACSTRAAAVRHDGYAATSLTALCAQAGVSPRHFYELYAGREPLMADLYDEIVLETARLVDEAYAAAPPDGVGPHLRRAAAAITHQTDDPRRARILHLEAVGVSPWLEQHRGASSPCSPTARPGSTACSSRTGSSSTGPSARSPPR
jgi:hypothetical protein